MNLDAYFQRIHYTGAREPNLANLRAIHLAHMRSVPFENLDIHIGRWIKLDAASLFNKIVNERRGGFCFEQNGLFGTILRELGYEVIHIEANVHMGDDNYSIPMDHMALIVTIDGVRWLTDVGFGDSFLEPLELDNPLPQAQFDEAYKVEIDDQTGYFLQKNQDGEWAIQYRFFFEPHAIEDYNDACYYMQTSPKTHFTQKRVCSMSIPEGRISLSDLRFIETINGERTEYTLDDESQFDEILVSRFQIDLSPAYEQATRDFAAYPVGQTRVL